MLADLTGKLQRTLRLASVEVLFHRVLGLEPGLAPDFTGARDRPAVDIDITVLGYNEDLATYRIQLHDRSRLLADSTVSVSRGRRAVVGAADGPETTPYLFLVIEPARRTDVRIVGTEGVTPSRRAEYVAPAYPMEARKERIQGAVIVQIVIDESGQVGDVRVLRGLGMGVDEAAVEAVKQWRFEPALDAAGNPVAVYYNVTVKFILD